MVQLASDSDLRHLFRLTSILNELNIIHWLDSGTLLGVVRDDALIPHDGDIDISIYANPLFIPSVLLETLRLNYSRVRACYLNSKLVKVKIEGFPFYRKVDISIYTYDHELSYKSPQLVSNQSRSIRCRLALRLCELSKKILSFSNYSSFPFSWAFQVKYFRIDCNFLSHLSSITVANQYKFAVPNEYINYLELKYGNWKVPEKNWNFEKSDGMLGES